MIADPTIPAVVIFAVFWADADFRPTTFGARLAIAAVTMWPPSAMGATFLTTLLTLLTTLLNKPTLPRYRAQICKLNATIADSTPNTRDTTLSIFPLFAADADGLAFDVVLELVFEIENASA